VTQLQKDGFQRKEQLRSGSDDAGVHHWRNRTFSHRWVQGPML
jgi:hypothetical protein